MLQNFKRFAGTSAGAIFATLLSANFTSDEVMKIHKIMFLIIYQLNMIWLVF
jgi:predicted acylesterase/phospholipase RssA